MSILKSSCASRRSSTLSCARPHRAPPSRSRDGPGAYRAAMKIDCVGAGPGCLYFAILAKLRAPQCRVRIFERNPANRFPGWGVVLDHEIRTTLSAADAQTAAAIDAQLHRWETIDVLYQGRRTSSSGYTF